MSISEYCAPLGRDPAVNLGAPVAVEIEERVLVLVAPVQVAVGNYHLVAMFLNSTGVQLDAGVPDAFA